MPRTGGWRRRGRKGSFWYQDSRGKRITDEQTIAVPPLDVPEVGEARALLAKAGARAALGDATVVALAGATGSGKSTLFNALSGAEVSSPGVRRSRAP